MEASHSRLRILINGLHSKSGGGVTYLRNMVPLMADDPTIDLHLCLHEDQAGLLSLASAMVRRDRPEPSAFIT